MEGKIEKEIIKRGKYFSDTIVIKAMKSTKSQSVYKRTAMFAQFDESVEV